MPAITNQPYELFGVKRVSWYKQARPHIQRVWRGLVWASPGQIDAGTASLATFAAGLFAVARLDVGQLGAYSLLFGAFVVVNQVATELVLVPSQIFAIDQPMEARLGMLRHSVPRGGLVAIPASLFLPLGLLPVITVLPISELAPLALSAMALAILSPLQDHLRSMFHLASRSWVSAAMSIVHAAGTGIALAVLGSLYPLWAPYGALAIGNALSLTFAGFIFSRIRPSACRRPTRHEMTSMGGWLLANGLVKTGSAYAGRALLNTFAGITALGFVEAARVASQPLNVLSLGLIAQAGPGLTQASAERNLQAAKLWRRRFFLLFCLVGIPYVALTSVPWRFNPLAILTPRAFEVPGLTVATMVGVMAACLLRPFRVELLGVRLQKVVTQVTVLGSLIELALMPLARLIGGYVVPLGLLLGTAAGIVLFYRKIREVYVYKPSDVSSVFH